MKKAQIIPHFLEAYRAGKLRVGFSGGADSTALLLLLLKWGFVPQQLEAVHFDHGLRGSASTADGQWCRDFCAERGINFILVKLDLSRAVASGGSLEDAARNARLQWYRDNDDRSPIVLAHHAGDVQENMLLKLARGGNVSALTSLRPERKLWNLTILRPLLQWQKSELEDFLRNNAVPEWRHDATNAESVYHRNFLRNEILEKWAEFHSPLKDGISHSAHVLAMDADFIEQAAAAELAGLGKFLPLKTGKEYWLRMHDALLGRVLRSYLAGISGQNDVSLTFQNVENFKSVLQKPASSECRIFQLTKDFQFRITGNTLDLRIQNAGTEECLPAEWFWAQTPQLQYGIWQITCELMPGAVSGKSKDAFYFDADLMPQKLYCLYRRGGEVMQVWGSRTSRHVKHLLCGAENKENMLIIADEKNDIYLLGNLRRSIHAPVSADTRRTLKITVSDD